MKQQGTDIAKDNFVGYFTNFSLGTTFPGPATPLAEAIIDLHHYITFYLIIVLVFVIAIFLDIFVSSKEIFGVSNRWRVPVQFIGLASAVQVTNVYTLRKVMFQLNKVNHATVLETIWTVVPSFILVMIAVPSLSLLYSMDEILYPKVTVKVTGYQWYWSYEFVNLPYSAIWIERHLVLKTGLQSKGPIHPHWIVMNYDSYMVNNEWSEFGHRLLTADRVVRIPYKKHIRVLVTAADVLHSWAVPALGIKIDAVPGRLNQGSIYAKRYGVFYGQCSELCGVNHGFMPIVVITQRSRNLAATQLAELWDRLASAAVERFYKKKYYPWKQKHL